MNPDQSQSILPSRAVVSLSGGMDSTALLLHLLARGVVVSGISFDYGQKHRIELERLQANLEYFRKHGHSIDWRLVDLTTLQPLLNSALTRDDWQVPIGHYEQANMVETVVPNRNAIFLAIAYSWALSLANQYDCGIAVALGVHAGDHAIYPDCRPEFYDKAFAAFESGNWDGERVQRYLPFLHYDKVLILRDAIRSIELMGLDFETVFRNTCTSYSPDGQGRSSGTSGSDIERILAFHEIGRQDPLTYVDEWEVCLARALKMQNDHRKIIGKAGADFK